jgi:ATP-dependent helicase/nuclease subunit B
MTAEARQARLVDRLTRQWREAPPDHPVLIAGSTGSRGATRTADGRGVAPAAGGRCAARARPGHAGERLGAADRGAARPGLGGEDHPQFRLARVAGWPGSRPDAIPEWAPSLAPPARRATGSCRWPCGPRRSPTSGARRDRSCRASRGAAPCHLSQRAQPADRGDGDRAGPAPRPPKTGTRAALVSPDRNLTRQVAAALDRWNITPDDSAGEPLGLTAPGRFLRMVAQALSGPLTSEALVALLSHPLCHSGVDRGDASEVFAGVRTGGAARQGGVSPTRARCWAWAADTGGDRGAATDWAGWVAEVAAGSAHPGPPPFAAASPHSRHGRGAGRRPRAGRLGRLYEKDAGVAARADGRPAGRGAGRAAP